MRISSEFGRTSTKFDEICFEIYEFGSEINKFCCFRSIVYFGEKSGCRESTNHVQCCQAFKCFFRSFRLFIGIVLKFTFVLNFNFSFFFVKLDVLDRGQLFNLVSKYAQLLDTHRTDATLTEFKFT